MKLNSTECGSSRHNIVGSFRHPPPLPPFPPCIHVHSTSHVSEQQRRREIRSYPPTYIHYVYTTTLGIANASTITKHEHFSQLLDVQSVSLADTSDGEREVIGVVDSSTNLKSVSSLKVNAETNREKNDGC